MLYAVPQQASDSLKLIKTVLQLIASQQEVSQQLKLRVYEVIREASNLSVDKGDQLQIPSHRESISLAVEIRHTKALAKELTKVTSEDMLEPVMARNVLEYI
ncbi:TPA: hypothetical protein ACPZBP_003591 [Escherichia coli]|nr:hypothetical protein [Escherichia coli]HCT6165752.1 hypothetical protein [Escherichia coli]